jgi:hypothetical protein
VPYQLEYKRTIDSTWTVWSSTLTAAQFPVTIAGLVGATQYDVRCLARDLSGNVSAYSAISQATTQGTIVWQSVPTVTFTKGAGNQTFNYRGLVAPASGLTFTDNSSTVALPAGVVDNLSLGRYEYTDSIGVVGGSNGHVITADDGAGAGGSDWAAILSSPGLLSARRYTSQADVTTDAFDQTNAFTLSHVVWDSTIATPGAAGSCRFNVLDTDQASSGSLVLWIDPVGQHVYNNGGEFFIRWRQYMPTAFCQTAFPGSGGITTGKANGFKQMILSQYYNSSGTIGSGGSNVGGEIVVENTEQMSCPRMYYTDSNGSDQLITTPYNGGNDWRWQNQINNVAIPDPNGTLTYPTSSQKYGPMYAGEPRQTGTPDPNNGGYVYRPNEWQTFMVHVRVGTIGSSNTLIEMWCAGDGLAPKLVHKITNANPGNGNNGNGNIYTGFTMLPYNTAKTGGGGVNTFTCVQDIATATQKLPFPGGFTVTPS